MQHEHHYMMWLIAAQTQPQNAKSLTPCGVVACSTNMAISDAGKLGAAISQHGGDLQAALQEYQQERLPQTAKEVRESQQPYWTIPNPNATQ